MFSKRKNVLFLIIGLVSLVFLTNVSLGFYLQHRTQSAAQMSPTPTKTTVVTPVDETFSYKGKQGKNALDLLKEAAPIEQDASGLVTKIKGRKADTSAKEYWSFYVNGKLAPVGPAFYKTIDSDVVEWKIETF